MPAVPPHQGAHPNHPEHYLVEVLRNNCFAKAFLLFHHTSLFEVLFDNVGVVAFLEETVDFYYVWMGGRQTQFDLQ